jgi:transcriptional regulator with GAF, ATPase, and Fis domain
VTLDCSSVVSNLSESELFEHIESAFIGASRTQKGKIELAGKGTLFLAELGMD